MSDFEISDDDMKDIAFIAKNEDMKMTTRQDAENVLAAINFLTEEDREEVVSLVADLYRLDKLAEEVQEDQNNIVASYKNHNEALQDAIKALKNLIHVLIPHLPVGIAGQLNLDTLRIEDKDG